MSFKWLNRLLAVLVALLLFAFVAPSIRPLCEYQGSCSMWSDGAAKYFAGYALAFALPVILICIGGKQRRWPVFLGWASLFTFAALLLR